MDNYELIHDPQGAIIVEGPRSKIYYFSEHYAYTMHISKYINMNHINQNMVSGGVGKI